MKYITKKPVRNRTSLLLYKNFFFHVLRIKCTFPESASRTEISVLKLKKEEIREEKYKRNQQAENQLIWFDMLSGVLSPPSAWFDSFKVKVVQNRKKKEKKPKSPKKQKSLKAKSFS